MANANACIAYVNLFDGASVTASSQQLLAPASNLQNPHIAKKWRSEEASSAYALADFGSSTAIDSLAAVGLTLSAAGTVRLRLSSTDSSGAAGDIYDSGPLSVDPKYNQAIKLLNAAVSGRYLRIDAADPGADFVEIGRIVAGVRAQFTRNFSYDWLNARIDRSIPTKTRGGQTQIWRDNSYRTLMVQFDFVELDQRYGLVEDIDLLNGVRDDVLFITDPTSTNLARDCIWGLMSEVTPVTQPNFEIFSKQYKIEERL